MRFKIQILYKSGVTQIVRANEFKCTYDGTGDLTGIEWGECRPRPLHIGINEIAAVFSLRRRWWR